MSVAEIVHTIEPYALFFEHSGGGVTISGGEVTAQPRFALNLLKAFKSRGISTAIETCGFARWRVLSALARCADLVLYDLKQMDREDHRRYTGVGNELILENLGRLARQGVAIQVRVPVMPGYNDSEENIHRTVEYATAVGVRAIAFLPCNPSAGSKYQAMGESFDVRLTPPSKERLAQFAAIASHAGLSAQIEW
jgi:pyruvate formate lyase activating enzyme